MPIDPDYATQRSRLLSLVDQLPPGDSPGMRVAAARETLIIAGPEPRLNAVVVSRYRTSDMHGEVGVCDRFTVMETSELVQRDVVAVHLTRDLEWKDLPALPEIEHATDEGFAKVVSSAAVNFATGDELRELCDDIESALVAEADPDQCAKSDRVRAARLKTEREEAVLLATEGPDYLNQRTRLLSLADQVPPGGNPGIQIAESKRMAIIIDRKSANLFAVFRYRWADFDGDSGFCHRFIVVPAAARTLVERAVAPAQIAADGYLKHPPRTRKVSPPDVVHVADEDFAEVAKSSALDFATADELRELCNDIEDVLANPDRVDPS